MKKILVPGILGAVVVYIWGMVSWMALPWHNATMKDLPNGDAIGAALTVSNTPSGVYVYPDMEGQTNGEMASGETAATKPKPYIFMTYVAEGYAADWKPYVGGFVLNLITAMLVGYLLTKASNTLTQYSHRVMFVTLMGVFAALVSHGAAWNWMLMPANYTLVMVADTIIAWLVAGLVMARFIKPATAAAS